MPMRPPVTSLVIHSWKEHGRPRPWQDPSASSDRDVPPDRHSARHAAIRASAADRFPRSWSSDDGLTVAATRTTPPPHLTSPAAFPTDHPHDLTHATPGCVAPSQGTRFMTEQALRRSTSHDAELRVHPRLISPPTSPRRHRATATPPLPRVTSPTGSASDTNPARGLNEILDSSDEDRSNDSLHLARSAPADPYDSDGHLSDCAPCIVRAAASARSAHAAAASLANSMSDDALRRHLGPQKASSAAAAAAAAAATAAAALPGHPWARTRPTVQRKGRWYGERPPAGPSGCVRRSGSAEVELPAAEDGNSSSPESFVHSRMEWSILATTPSLEY